MFKASDFKSREVINYIEGEKLGYVYDMEIDENSGKILSIIVPGRTTGTLFPKKGKIIIKWENIKKIGDDIILVDINA